MATIRSTPPRRPSQPRSLTRTSYHVGRPWMFDGKMLRGLTGTPIRRMDLAKRVLAEAEPDPFTLANLTTKSLTTACIAAASLQGYGARSNATSLLRDGCPVPPGGMGSATGWQGGRVVHPEAAHQLKKLARFLLERDGRIGGVLDHRGVLLGHALQLRE